MFLSSQAFYDYTVKSLCNGVLMSRDVNPFGLRMPSEVKEELEKLAEQNRRSLNAEIVVRLEQSIRQEGRLCITVDELRQIIDEALTKAGK